MIIRRTATFLVCLWSAGVLGAATHDETAKDITVFAETIAREFEEIPGFGLAIVRDGKPYMAAGFGFADRGRNVRANADTVYCIASSTKSYTGLAAAILHARGTIDLDAPFTRYVPEAKLPEGVDPQRVTLRRLLTHTAGIESDAIVTRTAFTGEHTQAKLVELLASSRKIDETFRYDNLGYVVASIALERATGKKWQNLLDELIFTPARMQHTSAFMSEAKRWPLATGYHLDRAGALQPMPALKTDATMHAAGGMVTTARDAQRWLEVNLNEGRGGGRQVIPAAAIALAHRKQATTDSTFDRFKRTGYGLGWYWSDFKGAVLLHHFGGFQGWRAHVSFMPKERIGVAILVNTAGPGADLSNVLSAYIYDRLRNGPDVNEAYRTELAEMKKTLAERMDRYRAEVERRAKRVSLLKHERNAYVGEFTSALYGTVSIKPDGQGLRASIGQLSSPLEPFTETETARVELVPGSGDVLRFVFDSDGRLASIKLWEAVFQRSDRPGE